MVTGRIVKQTVIFSIITRINPAPGWRWRWRYFNTPTCFKYSETNEPDSDFSREKLQSANRGGATFPRIDLCFRSAVHSASIPAKSVEQIALKKGEVRVNDRIIAVVRFQGFQPHLNIRVDLSPGVLSLLYFASIGRIKTILGV